MLFKEKSFKEFINFRLSTSQLFTPEDILIGYGAVVPDGYGCCYMPKSEYIYFCISSFYSAVETSSDFFASSLEGSLLQMRELCEQIRVNHWTNNPSNNPWLQHKICLSSYYANNHNVKKYDVIYNKWFNGPVIKFYLIYLLNSIQNHYKSLLFLLLFTAILLVISDHSLKRL